MVNKVTYNFLNDTKVHPHVNSEIVW